MAEVSTASYPSAVWSPSQRDNGYIVPAADWNRVRNEVHAIETELGTGVAGLDESTLANRLNDTFIWENYTILGSVGATTGTILTGMKFYSSGMRIKWAQFSCAVAPQGAGSLDIYLQKNGSNVGSDLGFWSGMSTNNYYESLILADFDVNDVLSFYVGSITGGTAAENISIRIGYYKT